MLTCDFCEREGTRGFVVEYNPIMTAYGMDHSNVYVYCKAEKACDKRKLAKMPPWTEEEVARIKAAAHIRWEQLAPYVD